MDLAGALTGIIGTVVGATLGAGLSWFVKKSELDHQKALRWDADKRNAYLKYTLAGQRYEGLLHGLHEQADLRADPCSVDRSRLDKGYTNLSEALTELLFYAGPEVGRLAQNYARELVPAFADLPKGHDRGPYGWAAVNLSTADPNAGVDQALALFLGAARKDLGLRTEVVFSTLPTDLEAGRTR